MYNRKTAQKKLIIRKSKLECYFNSIAIIFYVFKLDRPIINDSGSRASMKWVYKRVKPRLLLLVVKKMHLFCIFVHNKVMQYVYEEKIFSCYLRPMKNEF